MIDRDAEPARARRSLWSPPGFIVIALTLAALFALAHLGGLRDTTSILSGTNATPSNAVLGLIYTVLYFATVLGAPILILAAGIFYGLERVLAVRHRR